MKRTSVAVLFRTFLKTGDVIALFPLEPASVDGWQCDSYMHIGQHGGATTHICRRPYTRPSTPKEICNLACELRGLGYRLVRAYRRVPRNAYAIRRKKLEKK
jgi:hypothetical protein